MCVHMCTCACAWVYVHTHVSVSMLWLCVLHMCECVWVYVQVCMSVCMSWLCLYVYFRCTITVSILKRIQKLLSIPKDPSAPLGSAQLVALHTVAIVLGNMVLILSEQMV